MKQETLLPKPDRRTRKRIENSQTISDVATRLFMEHGFDHVTVDQIADAADVGRMTVFNHFPRKEDMFFDRKREPYDLASAALRSRDEGISPIEAIRLLAHRMIEERQPMLPLSGTMQRFVTTAMASEALKARARQMRSEFERELSELLAETVHRPADDADARLVAGLLVATWSVAFARSYEAMVRDGDVVAAGRAFLGLIDQGLRAVSAAMAETPYAVSNVGLSSTPLSRRP